MPKSFRHLVQALACLALLASASLQAQESRLDRILESGVLRVATTGDYKPFSYRTEEGGYAGFDVDMAQRLAESLGAKLVVVPTSWPNLMRDFADDRFDIAMSGIRSTWSASARRISRFPTCATARRRSPSVAKKRVSRPWSRSTSRA